MSEPTHSFRGARVAGTLRDRLRTDTHDAHVALDARVSGFDLATPAGLRGFLTMQVLALSALAPLSGGAASAPIIAGLRDRARADLTALAGQIPRSVPRIAAPLHPLALDYVITGSQLGTRVLKQRWAASVEPAVQAADAYFGAPDHIDAWKAFCTVTADHPATGNVADRIVADAMAVFYFYEECASSAVASEKEIDV